jgi:hypothetical protein
MQEQHEEGKTWCDGMGLGWLYGSFAKDAGFYECKASLSAYGITRVSMRGEEAGRAQAGVCAAGGGEQRWRWQQRELIGAAGHRTEDRRHRTSHQHFHFAFWFVFSALHGRAAQLLLY